MSETLKAEAKCLCGKVTVKAEQMEKDFHACHCEMCRTWLGSSMMASQSHGVSFEGEEHIKAFSSSEWAERGFCSECGTHLFYRTKDHKVYMLPIGLMKPGEPLNFHEQFFYDVRDKNYEFANDTVNLTREEIFKRFSS